MLDDRNDTHTHRGCLLLLLLVNRTWLFQESIINWQLTFKYVVLNPLWALDQKIFCLVKMRSRYTYFEHPTISSNIGYMSVCGSILHPPSPSSGRGRGWRQRDWLMTGRGGCRLIWPGTRLQARPREGCTSSSTSMQCASLFSSVTLASRQQNETADSWN